MEYFPNTTKAVKLRNRLHKYLVADDDQETNGQSRNGSSRKARWLIDVVDRGTIDIIIKSPRASTLRKSPLLKITAMEIFHNAKTVRLRSHHNKYLTAEEDEESVTQFRNRSSNATRWTVEFVPESDNIIRLRSCYNKYLTASNQPFLLGATGRKVLQTNPQRLDSSIEWEPIRDGNHVKLKTRYGQFLRANGGLPPWRNSVTHDIPHRSVTQDWILWDVDVVEIVVHSCSSVPPTPPPTFVSRSDSFGSGLSSPSTHSSKSASFSGEESGDSFISSTSKAGDGRLIYYSVADKFGEVDDGVERLCITFKGNGVDELTKRLEEETGLKDIVVCTRSPLDRKLYPLRLQLPPSNSTMNVIVLQSSSKVARALTKPVMSRRTIKTQYLLNTTAEPFY